MTELSNGIDALLKEVDECEMLGGLAATHEERVAHRQRAKELRALALEAQVLLDQSEAWLKGPQNSLPILNWACTAYPQR
jgi:hypothetical protein